MEIKNKYGEIVYKTELENYRDILLEMIERGVQINDIDLSNQDFSNLDIPNFLFWGDNLENTNFSGANLENAQFVDCNLTNTNFIGSKIRGDVLTKNPVYLDYGTPWKILILDTKIIMGCQCHTLEKWEEVSNAVLARIEPECVEAFNQFKNDIFKHAIEHFKEVNGDKE